MKHRGDLDEPLEFFLTVESAEELETCPSFVVEVSMEGGEVNVQVLEVKGVRSGVRGEEVVGVLVVRWMRGAEV